MSFAALPTAIAFGDGVTLHVRRELPEPDETSSTTASANSTSEEDRPDHAFQTNFAPESLTKFLRSEFERSRPSTVGKMSQGKESSTDVTQNPKWSTTVPRASTTRRSERIARRGPNNSEPTLTTQPISSSADLPLPSRRATFEEHTKNKRRAVRNMVLNESDNQTGSDADIVPQPSSTRLSRSLETYGSFAKQTSRTTSTSSGHVHPSTVPSLDGSAMKSTTPVFPEETSCKSAGESDAQEDIVGDFDNESTPIPAFNYSNVVPERIPPALKLKFLDAHKQYSRNEKLASNVSADQEEPIKKLSRLLRPEKPKADPAFLEQFPRVWKASHPPQMQNPKILPALRSGPTSSAMQSVDQRHLNSDSWREISRFLSSEDVKNLRLVNKAFAAVMAPIQFRNVVANFGRNLFDVTGSDWDGKSGQPPTDSMFKRYGSDINELGIGFEYDVHGLMYATPKVIEKEHVAWFGKFKWPAEQYPRFEKLQSMEDLVDNNRPLMKEALSHVTRASELGLCVDSGHGWLEGPDISDLALFNRRIHKGSKIFGKTFATEDVWITFAREEYFKWAQRNSINESMKHFLEHASPKEETAAKAIRFLDGARVHDMQRFKQQQDNNGQDSLAHTGGSTGVAGHGWGDDDDDLTGFIAFLDPPSTTNHPRQVMRIPNNARTRRPRWPLIFNGHSLVSEHGGECKFIQTKTGDPNHSPLKPGFLSEAQAQWLLETLWAQRAFLSSYTTAIIANKQNFNLIHTLRISKLSSGLLPFLEQREFWDSLPGLNRLQLLVIPDWRREHTIGDKSFADNMAISPAQAAQKFTNFLRVHIARIESLYSLTVGYAAGGEHAVGLFARNKHVLPAPIVYEPGDWLFDPSNRKHAPPLTKFDHIRDLRFENCWFTPWMLEGFMTRSRDTSLHSLTLDSVSMVTYHDPELDRSTTTSGIHLRCKYGKDDWTRENLASGAAWAKVLDAITPGVTLLEHQLHAGRLDPDIQALPPRPFRGHIQRIILSSCGYVEITVPKRLASRFHQRALVTHGCPRHNGGLSARKDRFVLNAFKRENPQHHVGAGPLALQERDHPRIDIMMNEFSPGGTPYPWLGTLTECIHPIEKRVLEEAWGMKFGWGNTLDRFAAVEDGCREGGTGRFSGMLTKAEE